jgi:glutaredoxin
MVLYVKENCQQCENVKRYIKSAKLKHIEIKQLSEEARDILINQGAKQMPLLVKNGMLLEQGSKVIDYLIELKTEKNKVETFNGMTYPRQISNKKEKTTGICDLTVPYEELTEKERADLESEMERFIKNL